MGNIQRLQAQEVWRKLLQDYLGAPVTPVKEKSLTRWNDWEDVLDCAGLKLAVEYKVRSDTASILAALEKMLSRLNNLPKTVHPLLVVDLMGPAGSALCEQKGIDWLDLAGNAKITQLPRTRIMVERRRPSVRPRGRKSNIFATKSSRVAHWFLLHPHQSHTHGQIAEATGLNKGHLSRLLSRMVELRLIRREQDGFRLTKPAVMLDAWREAYESPCENVLKGVIPSRSGEETVSILEKVLHSTATKHVFGGLSSAWMWDRFADFRLTTCYIWGVINPQLLKKIDFIETGRGANVWLMQEADKVAFLGAERRNQINLASPWFTYVDLSVHPERSSEAADHLRQNILKLEVLDGA